MDSVPYIKVYNALLAFEKGEYEGATATVFWKEVEERFGLSMDITFYEGHIKITNEHKFTLFLLKYSDVL